MSLLLACFHFPLSPWWMYKASASPNKAKTYSVYTAHSSIVSFEMKCISTRLAKVSAVKRLHAMERMQTQGDQKTFG